MVWDVLEQRLKGSESKPHGSQERVSVGDSQAKAPGSMHVWLVQGFGGREVGEE